MWYPCANGVRMVRVIRESESMSKRESGVFIALYREGGREAGREGEIGDC
jgi:hypothetical protein